MRRGKSRERVRGAGVAAYQLEVVADQLGSRLGALVCEDNFAELLELAERYSLPAVVGACVKLCNSSFAAWMRGAILAAALAAAGTRQAWSEKRRTEKSVSAPA